VTTTPQPLTEEPTQPTPAAEAEPAAPPAVGPAPGTGEATRDMQRSALRDLVVLSTESAATEARIEADRVQALETAAKEFDKSTFSIRERFKTMEEQVRQKYADRVARTEAAYKQGVAKTEADAKRATQTIEAEAEPISRKLKDKLNHDIWLADSVFDVAQNQFKAQAKKSSDQYESQLKELESVQEKAAVELARYKQKAPAVDGAVEAQAAGTPGQYAQLLDAAEQQLRKLKNLFVAGLLVGASPYIILIFFCALAGAGAHFIAGGGMPPRWPAIGIGAGAMLVIALVCGIGLRRVGKRQVQAAYQPLAEKLSAARASAKADLDAAEAALEAEKAKALQRRDREVKSLTERMAPFMEKASSKREAALQAVKTRRESELTRFKTERTQVRAAADASFKKHLAEVAARQEAELRAATSRNQAALSQTRNNYQQARSALERRLADGLENIRVPTQPAGAGRVADPTGSNGQNGNGDAHAIVAPELPAPITWDDPAWSTWKPPMKFSPTVRFGELLVDLRKKAAESGAGITVTSAAAAGPKLDLPEAFAVPANLAFPQGASLLIQTDRDGRDEAIGMLQMTMARLLTWLPAGRVRFIIIDPVGLGQTFSGFMHLADYDEALIGVRIWTEAEQIDKRLQDMTEHMETVIQKYLRNEYATIDDYNAQAGELAEPYRFLVLADFPAEFSTEALRRLSSIAVTGQRCGVYTLVIRDTRMDLPSGIHMDEVVKSSVNLVRQSPPSADPEAPPAPPRFVWQDEVFRQFPLTCDPPPTEEQMTKIANIVGHGAKLAKRVEVNFDSIAPKLEEFWSRSTASEMTVPVGRRGATRLQDLSVGKGVAQHVLIAGKTGSGKSSLLNALVTNLAMWYSPDEVEFYLIDFKKGVEFKAYASQRLPHARAIAVESDREFGLSVLQRLDGELTRRGDMYRRAAVQDLAAYRKVPGAVPMPRTLLLIDEFQEFFSEDDKLAGEASLLLDRLVRQGRAFGIHVLLGSQTIGGNSGLNRSTIGQMAVRVALMTSEADSQVILGDGNSAARLLTRPGEAIYNDQGGLVEANSPFQVAWLPDERREQYLKEVRRKYDALPPTIPPRDESVVFEGNMPADVTQNKALDKLISASAWPATATIAPRAWIGDPVAIRDPSAITFRRQSGSNVILIGQADEAALAILCTAMVSLAAQQTPTEARFYVLDGSAADSPFAGVLESVRTALPHQSQSVDYRTVPDAMAELNDEVKRRQAGGQDAQGQSSEPEIYVIIYGLQRYRALRKSEDSFGSFSAGGDDDEEKKLDPGKVFTEMLRDGPPLGIHVLAWCDTPISVERTLDRGTLREFDNRILFQMSASDSSNLIDSPLANKLGFNRALAYSEEQGTVEKFRPYGPPPKPWLAWVKQQLSVRNAKLPPASVPKPKPAPAAPARTKPIDAPTPPTEAAAVDTSIEEEDDDPGLAEFLKRSGLTSEPAEPAGPAGPTGADGVT
jgi:S-DNA-T family DNA segregation ATPase FtsK/SpoIIIE